MNNPRDTEMTVKTRLLLAGISLMALARGAPPTSDVGKEWLNDVLVIVSPGPDAMGGRVPGSWYPNGRAGIAVSREHAFTGKSSLKIQLNRGTGGCQRIVTAPGGKFRMVFSSRIFVPNGQSFKALGTELSWICQAVGCSRIGARRAEAVGAYVLAA